MKKTLLILAILFILVVAYNFLFTHKKYDYPLNMIEKIKYFEPVHKQYGYHAIQLTPTEYRQTPFYNILIVRAIYKDEIIGIKIEKPRTGNKIIFKSIGKAIAELYEEDANENTIMRSEMKSSGWNGEAGFVNWHWSNDCYKLSTTA